MSVSIDLLAALLGAMGINEAIPPDPMLPPSMKKEKIKKEDKQEKCHDVLSVQPQLKGRKQKKKGERKMGSLHDDPFVVGMHAYSMHRPYEPTPTLRNT